MSKRTRILAIDHGTKRLGLAVSDSERRIASPLHNYTRRALAKDGRFLQQVLEEEAIGLVVIGLPVHLDGHEGDQAHRARQFGAWLGQLTGMPCAYWDERFSTVAAEAALWDAGLTHKKRRARRDQVAAQVLLQAYLEAGCPQKFEARGLEG